MAEALVLLIGLVVMMTGGALIVLKVADGRQSPAVGDR